MTSKQKPIVPCTMIVLAALAMGPGCAGSPSEKQRAETGAAQTAPKQRLSGPTNWYADLGNDDEHSGRPHVSKGEVIRTIPLPSNEINLIMPSHQGAVKLEFDKTLTIYPSVDPETGCGLNRAAGPVDADKYVSTEKLDHGNKPAEEHAIEAFFFEDPIDQRRELCLKFIGIDQHLGQAHTHEDD